MKSGMREEREERQRLADITAQMAKLYTPEVPLPSQDGTTYNVLRTST